jgi:hypothetical protein
MPWKFSRKTWSTLSTLTNTRHIRSSGASGQGLCHASQQCLSIKASGLRVELCLTVEITAGFMNVPLLECHTSARLEFKSRYLLAGTLLSLPLIVLQTCFLFNIPQIQFDPSWRPLLPEARAHFTDRAAKSVVPVPRGTRIP